ncbi:hypothetical protein QTP81_14985 [Alteromonas sp. ASW11-36]|uniref:Uncharacterized protein n=1 Tax=Alteromonas arenosi TaxID=3055817 RepID=A0ABT7T0E2_9ALTE|nr:hypothetical protein [Alteromonas sp. ASW11-36]MDM7861906.1 hypothetical protein [Alteromonas sp. ASW11-36]
MNDLFKTVERIITLNHAWKVARDEFGADHSITNALRLQKSSWQATLLRSFPSDTYLKRDNENIDGESLLSVRLSKPLNINGHVRNDAEHIPERMARHLFFDDELTDLIR